MRNEKGVVLVIAVLVMISATILGIAAMMTSDIEVRMSGNQRCMETAFYAAEGGIESGLGWLASSGIAKPDETMLPTMKETKENPDPDNPSIFSEYYIGDLRHSKNPLKGWDVTKFRRYYYQIYSEGGGPHAACAEVEAIASVICCYQEY